MASKANIIYVKRFVQEPENTAIPKKSEKPTSASRKNRLLQVGKTDRSNTDNNKIYLSENNNQSVCPVNQENKNKEQTDRPTDIPPSSKIEQQELERLYKNGQTHLYQARLFIESVIKKLYTDGNMPYILKMGLTHREIQDRLRLLTHAHIDAALAKMEGCKTNKELYFAKCLLTALVEIPIDDLLREDLVEAPHISKPEQKTTSLTQKVPQRDNFNQRECSDEQLCFCYS